nr:PAS domain S-box protein [Candidatus Eremiobacteraeota bacterium]
MAAAQRPTNEAARLAALSRYDLPNAGDEKTYDPLVALAAKVCGTSTAFISIVEGERQIFISAVGVPVDTVCERDVAFCSSTILHTEIFEVHDAQEDPRFCENPLVTGEPRLRFYAGVPLVTGEGFALGALCVMDREVGWLTAEQREQLHLIAASVVHVLEGRLLAGEAGRLTAFANAFTDAPEMMIVTDRTLPPNGWPVILAVNDQFVRATGYSKEEIVGKTTSTLFGEDTNPRTIETLKAAVSKKETVRQEFWAYRKDGSSFLVETHSRAIFDTHGRYLHRVISARDITERRTAQGELTALRALIDEATDFIFTTDATPTWLGGPFFTYANNALLRATGYTPEELLGRSPAFLYGPDTDKAAVEELIRKLDLGEAAGAEFIIYKKDGTPFWAEFNGRPIADSETSQPNAWIAVGRDITARRQTQQQLTVLSAAINGANDCIIVYEVDPQSINAFRVVFVNEATLRESGFTREELMSEPTGTGPETDLAAVK